MAWNDPNELTWAEGSPLTSEDMISYVKDNLLALRALNVEQVLYKPSATILTNSTSFVDADPVNLKLDIDISSDRLLAICKFRAATDNKAYFDLIVNQDGSTDVRAGDATDGLYITEGLGEQWVLLMAFWTGLEPGTKTVKLQMRSDSGNIGVHNNASFVLTAWEV